MLDLAQISVTTAILAGLISFVSPCVLPLVPGYVSYIAGSSIEESRPASPKRARFSAIGLSVAFVLGFSAVFVTLGASATVLGQILLSYRWEATTIGGAIVIGFGLFLIGLLRVPWLQREWRIHSSVRGGRPLGAFAMGLGFAFGWTPCIGPILGAILTISASTATVGQGIALLTLYSLGLGLPFVAAAAFTDSFVRVSRRLRRAGRVLQIVAGAVLVLKGAAMISGRLPWMSFWLLEQFPGLGQIG